MPASVTCPVTLLASDSFIDSAREGLAEFGKRIRRVVIYMHPQIAENVFSLPKVPPANLSFKSWLPPLQSNPSVSLLGLTPQSESGSGRSQRLASATMRLTTELDRCQQQLEEERIARRSAVRQAAAAEAAAADQATELVAAAAEIRQLERSARCVAW